MGSPTELRRAAKRYEQAKAAREAAIREAAAAGMTRRAIAKEVGISFQRVQQIVRSANGDRP
jgi:hypothetical protein